MNDLLTAKTALYATATSDATAAALKVTTDTALYSPIKTIWELRTLELRDSTTACNSVCVAGDGVYEIKSAATGALATALTNKNAINTIILASVADDAAKKTLKIRAKDAMDLASRNEVIALAALGIALSAKEVAAAADGYA